MSQLPKRRTRIWQIVSTRGKLMLFVHLHETIKCLLLLLQLKFKFARMMN